MKAFKRIGVGFHPEIVCKNSCSHECVIYLHCVMRREVHSVYFEFDRIPSNCMYKEEITVHFVKRKLIE